MIDEKSKIQGHILVVEDDEGLRGLIVNRLNKAGYPVIVETTGAAALESIASNPPAALLIDQKLPDMAGQEILTALAGRGLKIPFIVITGQGEERLAVQMMKLGASDYLVKDVDLLDILPVAMQRLFNAIQTDLALQDAENSLRESEARFRLLAENSTDMISRHDLQGKYLYVSPACRTLLGYAPEELIGHSAFEFVHPDDIQPVEQSRLNILAQPVVSTTTFRILRKDGGAIWLETTSRAIYDQASGALLEIHAASRDITERKRAEAALYESTRRYRELFENSRDGFVVVDTQGCFLEANEAYCEMLGFSLNELQAKEDFYAVTPERWRKWEHDEIWCNRLLKIGASGVYEKEYVRKDGTIFPVELQSFTVKDNQGNIRYLWGIARDITARKRIEETLRESEQRYRLLAENTSDVIWTIDINLQSTYTSPAVKRLRGYESEEAVCQPLQAVLAPASFEIFSRVLAEELEAEKMPGRDPHRSRTLELEVIRKDGSTVWTEVTITFLRGHDGQPVEILGVTRDITERKRTQEALEWQTRFQRLLMDISLTYINLPPAEVSAAINQSLAELGTLVGADRVYIFAYDFPAGVCQNTHEWCAVGIAPQISDLQAVPLEGVPEWVTAHTSGQDMHIPSVEALPPGNLKDILAPQNIKSLLTVPMMDGTTCVGFVGFDSVHNLRTYSEDEKRLLRVFAGLLVNVDHRKRADEKLRSTQANMTAIIENTLDNIWAINTNYEILYTNEVFARAFDAIFGVLLMPGDNLLQSMPAPIRPTWKKRYDRAFNGERFIFVDAIEADGAVIYIEVAVNPIVHDGKVVGASFFGRDISARKQAEKERDIAFAKYQTLFETFPLGISVTDEQGSILETNWAAEKLLAVPKEEHTRRDIDSPVWRIIREDGTPMPPGEFASVRALQEKRLVENVRMGILKPDETVTWLYVTAAPLPVPGYGVVVTYSDVTAQLRAEQTLRENNQFVTSLLRAIPVAVFFKDWECRYLGCNDVFTEIMGVSAETIRGKTVYELWPEELAQIYHEKDLELMRNRQHQSYEFQVKDKDGLLRPVIFAKDIFLDASGEPAGMVGAFIDISERKRMEDMLNIKEWAIASSINGIALADLTGNLTFVNPAMLAMWGYEAESEVLGRNASELWQARDEATNIMAVLRQNGSWRGELPGKRRDGSSFIAEVTASRVTDEIGHPLCLLGVFADITERKQAELALRESERKYRQLSSLLRLMADTMPDMLWAKNLNNEYIFVNQAICERLLSAADTTEPLGKTDLFFATRERVAHPENPEWHTFGEICRNSDAITLQELKPMQFDEFGTVKGEFLYLDVHKAPLYDDDGQLIGVVGSARDVTARKRDEELLKKTSQEIVLAYDATLQGWSHALELRENETAGHSQRVVEMTLRLARAIGVPEGDLPHIQRGALLHDIGKMGIPDSILLKAGRLNPDEWEIMHQHPLFAYRMLSVIPYLAPALDIPRYHHEKWDGTGYPYGLQGAAIPLSARIFAVVDVWDALSNNRPYRPALSAEEVLRYIQEQSGKYFDPHITEVFLKKILPGND